MKRKILLHQKPVRIVSLVPSQTELLWDLGLEEEVIGITKFCVHPEAWYRKKARIGGTKKLNIDLIRSLAPDLILGNKEENEKSDIELLMREFPVWMSDISTLEDALAMIAEIGSLTAKQKEATLLINQIRSEFSQIPIPKMVKRCAYLIWKDPYMIAGTNTFIQDMIFYCGLRNVFNLPRYPQISAEMLQAANPEVILLSSEPYPFKEKHIQEFRLLCPNSRVVIVDGEMFSWYGSHLKQAPKYFQNLALN